MYNHEILVLGYGSLLSGYGLLAERRGGASRLVARDVQPVRILNAKRGLAKPSSHGQYLAMDIEPIVRPVPLTASVGLEGGGIGALLLTFDRKSAPMIARREEYDPEAFERLIEIAERAGKPLGEFLIEIAARIEFRFAGIPDHAAHDTRLHLARIYFPSECKLTTAGSR